MTNQLGHHDDILPSNLKNLLFERVGNEMRVDSIEKLGLLEEELIAKLNTPIDTITHFLANKLSYKSNERDIIIMRHNIGIEWPDGTREEKHINFVVYGDPNGHSAMAKTVGYPAGCTSDALRISFCCAIAALPRQTSAMTAMAPARPRTPAFVLMSPSHFTQRLRDRRYVANAPQFDYQHILCTKTSRKRLQLDFHDYEFNT